MISLTIEQITKLQQSKSPEHFSHHLQDFGIVQPSLAMLIQNTYSFATLKEMSIQQKQAVLNVFLHLVFQIPKLSTIKSEFFHSYAHKIQSLAYRSPQNLAALFSRSQTEEIRKFFQKEVLPYYEIYELIFDENPEFILTTEIYEPITTISEPPIYEGTVVQPETIEILKGIVGERAPKQEKKEVKKK